MYIYLSEEGEMTSSYTHIRNILFGIIGTCSLFLTFLYSDQIMIGFSEFAFLSGSETTNEMSFGITGGFTTGFTVMIYNKESTDMTYKLGFVDGTVTNDSLAKKTCLSPNENQNFGQYIAGDTSPFTLAAGTSGTKDISITFPNTHNGIYTGCVTLNAIPTTEDSYANTLPTRGIFLEANVYSNTFSFIIKAYPSNRVYPTFNPYNDANTGIVKIYDINKQFVASSDTITLDGHGYGTGNISVAPGMYYIVFKGQSHLASYISGQTVTALGTDVFDFTTGSNLYGTQENSAGPNGYRYQTAGDLKNTSDQYDFVINGNDISIMLYGNFPDYGVNAFNPRNLNGDTAINAGDISIIGNNVLKQDAFAADGGIFIWQ